MYLKGITVHLVLGSWKHLCGCKWLQVSDPEPIEIRGGLDQDSFFGMTRARRPDLKLHARLMRCVHLKWCFKAIRL